LANFGNGLAYLSKQLTGSQLWKKKLWQLTRLYGRSGCLLPVPELLLMVVRLLYGGRFSRRRRRLDGSSIVRLCWIITSDQWDNSDLCWQLLGIIEQYLGR
jgi:hypothetical protein